MSRTTDDRCIMTHSKDPDRPRQALPGLYLCEGHKGELERLVTEYPAYYDDLQRAHTPGGGGRPVHGAMPLAIDEDTARHRSHMAGVLASWCAVVAQDRGITPPTSTEPADMSRWLRPHLDWCAAHDWASDMIAELRGATGKALGMVDIRAHRVLLAARCLTHQDGERCEGAVTITVRGDDWTAYCPVCETVQEAAPYLRGVRGGRWVTAEEVIAIARVFDLPCGPDVVRQWRHRRRILGSRSEDGTVVYDLASVQAYIAGRSAAQKARRLRAG
ncbi:hypothetical protein OHR68_43290 [Spirillospora sp. NBC_00431]